MWDGFGSYCFDRIGCKSGRRNQEDSINVETSLPSKIPVETCTELLKRLKSQRARFIEVFYQEVGGGPPMPMDEGDTEQARIVQVDYKVPKDLRGLSDPHSALNRLWGSL